MFGKIVDNELVLAPSHIKANLTVDGRLIEMQVSNPTEDILLSVGYKRVVEGDKMGAVPQYKYKTIEYIDGEEITVNEVLHDKVIHEAEEPVREEDKIYTLIETETETEVFRSYVVQEKPIEVQEETTEE